MVSNKHGAGTVRPHNELVEDLSAAVDDQSSSLFITKLPIEVRGLIYNELWRSWGPKLHLHSGRAPTPCLIDETTPDDRFANFKTNNDRRTAWRWERRLASGWTIHWQCEEASLDSRPRPSPFLPMLLTCKHFYLEGFPSIFEAVTFCITDMMQAGRLLSTPWAACNIRSVDVSLQITASLTDFYLLRPGTDSAIIASTGQSGTPVNARSNVWETACRALAAMPQLRRLRIWIDSRDLRPWHEAAAETRLFASLAQIRRPQHFVLCLPKLPDDDAARSLPGLYLEGAELDGKPFKVERGDRPNKWVVFLTTRARTGRMGAANFPHAEL